MNIVGMIQMISDFHLSKKSIIKIANGATTVEFTCNY